MVRSGGLPQGFLCGFFVQSPSRSRTAARPVRGEGEACVSSRSAQPWVQLGMGSLAFWCALLAKRKPDNQPARRSVSQSHLSDPRIMQSMLLLFACSAVALLPAPARQHRARGVVRMGWGDPPVCEPRPRSGFCARCTPSTRRHAHQRSNHRSDGVTRRRSGPRRPSNRTPKLVLDTAPSSWRCPPRPRKRSRPRASTSN